MTLFCRKNFSSFGNWSSVLLLELSHVLALQDGPGTACIFPTLALESAIFPRSPGSFY